MAPKFGHRPTDHDRRLHYQHTIWMIRRALCVHRRFGADGLFGELDWVAYIYPAKVICLRIRGRVRWPLWSCGLYISTYVQRPPMMMMGRAMNKWPAIDFDLWITTRRSNEINDHETHRRWFVGQCLLLSCKKRLKTVFCYHQFIF